MESYAIRMVLPIKSSLSEKESKLIMRWCRLGPVRLCVPHSKYSSAPVLEKCSETM